MPAKAGIHDLTKCQEELMPAFAGMSEGLRA